MFLLYTHENENEASDAGIRIMAVCAGGLCGCYEDEY